MNTTILHPGTTLVRPVETRDLEQCSVIDFDAYGVWGWTDERFAHVLSLPNVSGLVVTEGDEVRGYCLYAWAGSYVAVTRLAVDAWHRRRKLGALLVNQLQGRLSMLRADEVRVPVHERLLGAQLFLRSLGFKGKLYPRMAVDGSDAILFTYRRPCR